MISQEWNENKGAVVSQQEALSSRVFHIMLWSVMMEKLIENHFIGIRIHSGMGFGIMGFFSSFVFLQINFAFLPKKTNYRF
mmetsp:Transcript_25812/g.43533  ORF Transcript_25812/g.43533 Transcript_25812/m.43533 type:complete len:81 (+) Transcript_25812:1140-1382(+)